MKLPSTTFAIPYLKPSLMAKAARSFDKASSIILITVWGAAVIFMSLAYFTVQQSIVARGDLAEADAALPVLPTITRENTSDIVLVQIADRLKKRHLDKLEIASGGGTLKLSSTSADAYATWLSAINSLDTLAADVAWTIESMCIGEDCSGAVMSITLSGKKISFSVPPINQ